jgi:hypothetical protein
MHTCPHHFFFFGATMSLFECLGNLLERLEVYTTIPPTPMMMDLGVPHLTD